MDDNSNNVIRNNMFSLFIFALVAHTVMFVFFLCFNVTVMVVFNAASILLYLVFTLMYFKRDRYSMVLTSIILSAIEVTLHQSLAILCLGIETGFQFFYIMIIVLIVLQAKEVLYTKMKFILSVIISFLMIAVEIYSINHEPLYQLPELVRPILLAAVTVVSLSGIIIFSFNQWNISEHYRLRIEDLLSERDTKIFQMQEKIIRNFADIIEERDGNTGGHIKRTSAYVEAIIHALTERHKYEDVLTSDYVKMVISAAPLHDIGKISISDSILCKRGKLTLPEYEIMKTHSSIGGNMLEALLGDLESEEYVNLARDISLYHHEKWNGLGYPEGLKGEEIPLSARIMAVADVFDALTSERVYKDKFTLDKAYKIMISESGEQFDPVIITEFVRIRPTIEEIYHRLED